MTLLVLSLGEMFIQNKGEPLEIGDKQVVMLQRIEVVKGQEVIIEFLSSKNDYRQGIGISIDKNKGYIEVNNEKSRYPVFWEDTAPKMFNFKCFPKKDNGQLNIWNVWQVVNMTEGSIVG